MNAFQRMEISYVFVTPALKESTASQVFVPHSVVKTQSFSDLQGRSKKAEFLSEIPVGRSPASEYV